MKDFEEKKTIGTLFDGIAKEYDSFNHLLSMNIDKWWRKKAVEQVKPVDRLLDVAIGTADLTIKILKEKKAKRVTGIDLSREMMRIGGEKVAAMMPEKVDDVTFVYGSAQDMPFADDSFDAVTCAYGVRNFQNLDEGLNEFYRVVRPGGQLVILEFSYPENAIVRGVYDFLFTHFMPIVGKVLSRDDKAYRYFAQSVKNFIWGKEMISHITAAGFRNATYRTLTLGVTTIYVAEK